MAPIVRRVASRDYNIRVRVAEWAESGFMNVPGSVAINAARSITLAACAWLIASKATVIATVKARMVNMIVKGVCKL